MSKIKKKLVVIGGGFAGITFIKQILKTASKKFEIILVDKKDYQLFYPALFKIVSSSSGPSSLFSVAGIKFKDIFRKNQVNFIKRDALSILPESEEIVLKVSNGLKKKLEYDYLVVAPGFEPNSNKMSFSSFEDVLNIKTKLEDIFKTKAKREEVNISVVGAGPTGCELIVSTFEYVHKLADIYSHPHESIHLKLIEEKKNILPKASSWLQKKVLKALKEMGIEILSDKETLFAKADLTIYTTGLKSIIFDKKNSKPSPTLRFKKHKNIFVIKAETIQSAIHKGKYVADALKKLTRRKKIEPYQEVKNKLIIELGRGYALADLGLIKLKGCRARRVRRFAFLRYFISVLSVSRAFAWLKKYKAL